MNTLGIIDIGSNSIKLLIVKIKKNKTYESIYHKKFQTRLYDYTSDDKKELSSIGIKNFFGIISTFKFLCDSFSCDEIIAVGTESLRNIKNAPDLIDDIKNSIDIKIKILSCQEECYYGYLSSIPENIQDYVHIDIGGGSVEIGLVNNKKLIMSDSIPIGALNVTNKFNLNTTENKNLKDTSNYILQQLHQIDWIDKCINLPIIAIGGSIKTIGRLLQLHYNTKMNIHSYEIYQKDIKSLLKQIENLNVDEIANTTGISKTRADILLAALLIVNNILNILPSSKIIISQYTIRDGIIKEYIDKMK